MKRRLTFSAITCLIVSLTSCRSEQEEAGEKRTLALFRGDKTVRLSAIDIYDGDYEAAWLRPESHWKVLCSDPEALRYLETCFQEGDPKPSDCAGMITYTLRLRFTDGVRLATASYWFKGGIALYFPGYYAADGTRAQGGVTFKAPIPPSVKKIIDSWYTSR